MLLNGANLDGALVGHWHAEKVRPGTAIDAPVVLGVVL